MDSALLRIDPHLFTGLSPDTVYTSTVSGGYMSMLKHLLILWKLNQSAWKENL